MPPEYSGSEQLGQVPVEHTELTSDGSRAGLASPGLSVGVLFFLTSNGLVAVLIIVIFFGAGFLMLGSLVGGSLPYSFTEPGLEAAPSGYGSSDPSGGDHRLKAVDQVQSPKGSDAEQSSAALPSEAAVNGKGIEDAASNRVEAGPLAPESTSTAPSSPTGGVAAGPSAPSVIQADPRPGLSAADITALLQHGDSLLGTGDIVSARLFYERAAAAGDGHAALRVGATFDPAFLGRAGLGKVQADPAEARSWYSRAVDLGVADAKRQLDRLPTTQGQ